MNMYANMPRSTGFGHLICAFTIDIGMPYQVAQVLVNVPHDHDIVAKSSQVC